MKNIMTKMGVAIMCGGFYFLLILFASLTGRMDYGQTVIAMLLASIFMQLIIK